MIAHARKEHDKDGKGKHQDKPKLHHKRRHGLEKRHQGKQKIFFTIMACVTMTQRSATLCKTTGGTFSPTPYHGTSEALA
eukprot:9557142-Ditylum_brightwellii.AAC.1